MKNQIFRIVLLSQKKNLSLKHESLFEFTLLVHKNLAHCFHHNHCLHINHISLKKKNRCIYEEQKRWKFQRFSFYFWNECISTLEAKVICFWQYFHIKRWRWKIFSTIYGLRVWHFFSTHNTKTQLWFYASSKAH